MFFLRKFSDCSFSLFKFSFWFPRAMILLLLLEIIVTIIIKIIIKSKARLVFSNVLIRMIRKSQFFTHSKSNFPKEKSYTQVVTTIKIRHSGLASLCMCTTSFESSKSNISWTPGVIFLCVRSREPTIDIWRRGLSQHEIFPYFCSALSMDFFFFFRFVNTTPNLIFLKSPKNWAFLLLNIF